MGSYSLLIDTSNKQLSIGIAFNDKILDSFNEECWKQQSEKTLPTINLILKKNKIEFNDLKEVIVGIGPGSFTGVRIGITISKIICYSLNIKIYGVSSMKSLIASAKNGICIFNARADRSYVCMVENSKEKIKETIMKNEDVVNLIKKHNFPLYGEVDHLGKYEVSEGNIFEGMIKLKKLKKRADDIKTLDAIYLKDSNEYKKM